MASPDMTPGSTSQPVDSWSLTLHGPDGVLRRIESGETEVILGSGRDADVLRVSDKKSLLATFPQLARAVSSRGALIVATEIGRINAKGHLAAISLKKYGPRPNELEASLRNLLLKLKSRAPHPLTITTDSHPLYPKLIKEFFPLSEHIQVSSRDKLQKHRELIYSSQRKKIFDPMFALNQRCAMLRADLRRLTRRSWCTTKNIENLKSQLELYAIFNNQKLQPT